MREVDLYAGKLLRTCIYKHTHISLFLPFYNFSMVCRIKYITEEEKSLKSGPLWQNYWEKEEVVKTLLGVQKKISETRERERCGFVSES